MSFFTKWSNSIATFGIHLVDMVCELTKFC
jgi:hypothetical protein